MHTRTRILLASPLMALLLAACSGSGATAQPGGATAGPSNATSSGAPARSGTALRVRDFTVEPKEVTIHNPGALAVTNEGPTIHNITIRDAGGKVLGATSDLKTGQSETLPVAIATGSYTYFCSLAGHESLGIKGSLIVAP